MLRCISTVSAGFVLLLWLLFYILVEKKRRNRLIPSLNKTLEIIMRLPIEQQNYLIDILKKRSIDKRRKEIAENARQAKEFYRKGLKAKSSKEIITALRTSLFEQ